MRRDESMELRRAVEASWATPFRNQKRQLLAKLVISAFATLRTPQLPCKRETQQPESGRGEPRSEPRQKRGATDCPASQNARAVARGSQRRSRRCQ